MLESNLGPLEGQTMFLTAELSLHPWEKLTPSSKDSVDLWFYVTPVGPVCLFAVIAGVSPNKTTVPVGC